MDVEVEKWPVRIGGGTAGSSVLMCGHKGCWHEFLSDPGSWDPSPGDRDSATVGELIDIIAAHAAECPTAIARA